MPSLRKAGAAGVLLAAALSSMAAAQVIPGDCNGDGVVTIAEATMCVFGNIEDCAACDINGDSRITPDETAEAILNAGEAACGHAPMACPTASALTVGQGTVLDGDCDGDGVVTVQEVAICAGYATSGIPNSPDACMTCDPNGDGIINVVEVRVVQENAIADACAMETAACPPTRTPTATVPMSPNPTTTPPGTPTATVVSPVDTATATPDVATTPTAVACAGDCNRDRQVIVNELVVLVNIALGSANVSTCTAGDANGDQTIVINELLAAVNSAILSCPGA